MLLEFRSCLGKVLSGLVVGEDCRVEPVFECVVGKVFDDDGSLLLVDQPGRLGDELLGVETELREGAGRDSLQDRGDGAADQLGLSRDLAEQVVLHL